MRSVGTAYRALGGLSVPQPAPAPLTAHIEANDARVVPTEVPASAARQDATNGATTAAHCRLQLRGTPLTQEFATCGGQQVAVSWFAWVWRLEPEHEACPAVSAGSSSRREGRRASFIFAVFYVLFALIRVEVCQSLGSLGFSYRRSSTWTWSMTMSSTELRGSYWSELLARYYYLLVCTTCTHQSGHRCPDCFGM